MKRIGFSPVRVLVVDDEPDSRYVLVKLLRTMRCEAEDCEDGEACLDAVKRLRPHLILLDLAMPRMDGFQVLDALREQVDSSPRVVALSGYGNAETVTRCREAGFHGHELKPIRVERLQTLVREVSHFVLQSALEV